MKKAGFSLLVVLFITFISAITLVSQKRNIYTAYQQLGNNLGLNFNDISTQKYVNFIKSQDEKKTNQKLGIFLNQKIAVIDNPEPLTNILGTNSPADDKWIEVDLSEQKLYMKEGTSTVGSFLVSTGKWAPTPKGEWRIWTKLRYTRMSGGSQALGTYYNLPNVPYTMYYNQGYGIHGAYWHNNFGNPMSHGCVNMKPEEAGIVFNWAQVGTRVVIHS